MNWILDAAVVLIIAGFVAVFAAIGFSRAFFGLLSGIVAVVLAFSFCGTIGGFLSERWIKPAVTSFVEDTLNDTADKYASETYGDEKTAEELDEKDYDSIIDGISGKLGGFLSALGISREDIKKQYDEAASAARGKIAYFAENISISVADGIGKAAAFILIFIIALVLLKLVSMLLDRIFKLPVLKQINRLGGAAVGAICGMLAVFVLISGFKVIMPNITDADNEPVISAQNIEDSYLFDFFYNFKL